uniref:Protein TsetseEP domain-containing protein n=1 Tax=Anopheles christyi TaxID=43041 RepID=A0A182K9X8_9DIPT
MGISIATLIVVSLLQCITADPRPEFALSAPVPGTSRVGIAASEAKAIISVLNNSTLNFTIRYNLTLLPTVFKAVQNVSNDFLALGTTVVTSITALASNSSGDVDTVFGAAIAAVSNASAYANSTLPSITAPLTQLIGKHLKEKLEDSFQHIGKALSALTTILKDLQTGARNALTEAGTNGTITSTIVSNNLRRSMITELVKALQLLRATVPVLKYTVDSTVEGIAIADQYLLDLSAKVASTVGEKSSIAADLDGIIQTINGTITNTTTHIDTELSQLKANFSALTNVANSTNGTKILTLLGDYEANVSDLRNKTPSIQTILNNLTQSVIDVYAIASPLFFLQDSYVVDALITTLIANADYSQYCFFKYKDFLFTMLETVSIDARECVDKEVRRLEYFRVTIGLILDLLFFDYEDIGGDLTVCNGISNTANLDECMTSLASIYVKLEEAFGEMFALGYDTVSREVTASKDESGPAMMRLLVFVLCMQSLSQLLPSALAKPDFGIKLPIKSSGKVSVAVLNAQTVLIAADDNTPFTANSNYKGLQELANVTVRVATELVNVGNDLIPNVTNLVSDISGNVSGAFATVYTNINQTKETISTKLPTAIADIKAVFKTHFNSTGLDYIPKQFNDGFRRIVLGLDDLAAKLQALNKAIDAAGNEAMGVTELTDTLVKQYVKPAFVYDVVFSVNQLKGYLPVIKYTIDSTLENIKIADDYLLLVRIGANDTAIATNKTVESVKNVTDAIANDVQTNLNATTLKLIDVQTGIRDTLNLITSAPNMYTVNAALSSIGEDVYKSQTERYPLMVDQLKALIDAITNALSGGSTTGQLSSPLLDSLILTVIENGKYAQFCFYKYMGLVFGFLTSLTDNAALCVDKEISRLEYLQETLALMWSLFPSDYESWLSELNTCEILTTPGSLTACVDALSAFYDELRKNFQLKIESFFELIETEASASTNRVMICIELTKLNLIEFTEPDLINDIRACAWSGPTADD